MEYVCLEYALNIYGKWMGQVWTTHGIRIDYERSAYEIWMEYDRIMWSMVGICMKYVLICRKMCDLCMEYECQMFGRCMEYEWNS